MCDENYSVLDNDRHYLQGKMIMRFVEITIPTTIIVKISSENHYLKHNKNYDLNRRIDAGGAKKRPINLINAYATH